MTLRSPLARIFYLFAGVGLIVMPAIALAAAYASGESGPPPPALIAGFAVVLLAGVAALRLSAVRVELHDDHVVLVNPLRRVSLRWADVEDIDLVSSPDWIVRVRAGGTWRRAWGASQFGQFGVAGETADEDDLADAAPRRVRDAYEAMRAVWQHAVSVPGDADQ